VIGYLLSSVSITTLDLTGLLVIGPFLLKLTLKTVYFVVAEKNAAFKADRESQVFHFEGRYPHH
jgi:hypothetical protein